MNQTTEFNFGIKEGKRKGEKSKTIFSIVQNERETFRAVAQQPVSIIDILRQEQKQEELKSLTFSIPEKPLDGNGFRFSQTDLETVDADQKIDERLVYRICKEVKPHAVVLETI